MVKTRANWAFFGPEVHVSNTVGRGCSARGLLTRERQWAERPGGQHFRKAVDRIGHDPAQVAPGSVDACKSPSLFRANQAPAGNVSYDPLQSWIESCVLVPGELV